jgi:hypothetical protein
MAGFRNRKRFLQNWKHKSQNPIVFVGLARLSAKIETNPHFVLDVQLNQINAKLNKIDRDISVEQITVADYVRQIESMKKLLVRSGILFSHDQMPYFNSLAQKKGIITPDFIESQIKAVVAVISNAESVARNHDKQDELVPIYAAAIPQLQGAVTFMHKLVDAAKMAITNSKNDDSNQFTAP